MMSQLWLWVILPLTILAAQDADGSVGTSQDNTYLRYLVTPEDAHRRNEQNQHLELGETGDGLIEALQRLQQNIDFSETLLNHKNLYTKDLTDINDLQTALLVLKNEIAKHLLKNKSKQAKSMPETYDNNENKRAKRSTEQISNTPVSQMLQNLSWKYANKIASILSNSREIRKPDDRAAQDEDKRIQNPDWDAKTTDETDQKRTKFFSWAGKRNEESEPDQKRNKFFSWAGKRNEENEPDQKRTKFFSWAGKRNEGSERGYEDMNLYKRSQNSRTIIVKPREMSREQKWTPFHSWGGKRAAQVEEKPIVRVPFNAWGGKRSNVFEENDFLPVPLLDGYLNEFKRTQQTPNKFHSWGGK